MSVNQEDVETFLHMFPDYELRNIIYDREMGIKGRKPELVQALLEEELDPEEIQELVQRYRRLQAEGEPKGYYLKKIVSAPPFSELGSKLAQNEVVINQEAGTVEKSGYEIHEANDELIDATLWDVSHDTFLNPLGAINHSTSISTVQVELDNSDNMLRMSTDKYGKTMSVVSDFEDFGVEFENVGHHNLLNETANDEVESFVSSLKSKLEEH